jgi:hypothetical protein
MAASKRRRRVRLPTEILLFVAVSVAFSVVYLAVLTIAGQTFQPTSASRGGSAGTSSTRGGSAGTSSTGGGSAGTSSAGGGSAETSSAGGGSAGTSSYKEAPVHPSRIKHPSEETSQPIQLSEYSRLYGERQISLLGSDATNLSPEAVKHAGDWKRAGDWDQGFLTMQETFKATLDPALPAAVPAFQPPFQVPAVQVPAVPACCVAP